MDSWTIPLWGMSNLQILCDAIIYSIDEDEYLLADGSYADGGSFTIAPTGLNTFIDRMRANVQAQHATCNGCFKRWGILKQKFQHNLTKHGSCFCAIANITQMTIINREPLFPVLYVDM